MWSTRVDHRSAPSTWVKFFNFKRWCCAADCELHLKCVCYFSFPESQGDALLLEVQDAKKSVQGRCTIPISSLSDNPVCILPISFNNKSSVSWLWPSFHLICCLMWLLKLCRVREFGGGPFFMMITNVLGKCSFQLVVQLHLMRLTI